MSYYRYCVHDGCPWAAMGGGDRAADDPATRHQLANPDHTVRGGESALHAQFYYRQQNGGNVTADAPTDTDWPLSHVAPGEVPRNPSEAERAALYAKLDALRKKVDEWSCDTDGCEQKAVGTRGIDGPKECRECAGLTRDETDEQTSSDESTQAQFVTEQEREEPA